ncbi:MAG TPA: hypothetical protein VKG62_09360 [Solirubrobacteraceae bacterium]|nr:hypothetical protein [Solirubrobacteraceae bacterium]
MAVDQANRPARPAGHYEAPPRSSRLLGGGTYGNDLLTSATGAVLIGLLAVIGVTILRMRPLISVHLFVGMLLLGPIALKLASTGYRFVRYYTGDPAYRRKGPPAAGLRAIAPIVVLSTVVVMASGVALLLAGPSWRDTLLPIHKVSFIVWVGFTGLHVLAHLRSLPPALRADYGPSRELSGDVTGRAGRVIALSGSLVAGVVIAIVSIPQFAAWTQWAALFHGHH